MEEHTLAFENSKQKITELPCLAHYNSDYPNVITTNASTKGLGASLWQEQPDGTLKPIGFASRFCQTRKEIRHKRTRTTGSSLGIRTFPFIYIRKTY